jgi:3,4-dihydroxy 2-butanone 4-phosphate synthase/GTP cyclohydrolase II
MKISVEEASEVLASGGMIIVTDHEDRENEGDLVGAVRFAEPEMINFMASRARGLICCALEQSIFDKAGISLLETSGGPGAIHGTRFGTPIDAIEGCTTGISAFDRSATLKRLVSPDCSPSDFARPGHMFPILEAVGGLGARQGHTEASVYLAKAAGLEGAAVICEMMDDDGRMVRGERIKMLAEEWQIGYLSVRDIAAHRETHDDKSDPLPAKNSEIMSPLKG